MEIEIKVRPEMVQPLLDLLKQKGRLKYKDKQVDQYFTPAHRNFMSAKPVEEWFRLRDSNGKYSLNYKKWIFDSSGKSNHCDENETGIESLVEAEKILSALNFVPLITVDKDREAWEYEDYEISIDRVKDLGDFVEIEYKGAEGADPKAITDQMIAFLNDLNCGELNRSFIGYPHLLLEKRGLI